MSRVTRELAVVNKLGLHARAAAKLVELAGRYASAITLRRADRQADAKSIMSELMVAAAKGCVLEVDAEGDHLLWVPATSGVPVAVSAWVRHDGLTGSKPQLVLRGESIAEQTATSTAADGEWEQLSVSATPERDEVLALVLRASNSGGSCRFSDLAVST